jgi:hypothetical protein
MLRAQNVNSDRVVMRKLHFKLGFLTGFDVASVMVHFQGRPKALAFGAKATFSHRSLICG